MDVFFNNLKRCVELSCQDEIWLLVAEVLQRLAEGPVILLHQVQSCHKDRPTVIPSRNDQDSPALLEASVDEVQYILSECLAGERVWALRQFSRLPVVVEVLYGPHELAMRSALIVVSFLDSWVPAELICIEET